MIKALVFDAYGTLYDVQSVAAEIEAAFPGHGDFITQIWRLKQLEYTWLRSMMGTYADFWAVTREALVYALDILGLSLEPERLESLAGAYNRLQPYPDSQACLEALSHYRRAVFSNGSPSMLAALIDPSALRPCLEAVISVDAAHVFKPDPRAYALVEATLGAAPQDVVFVSSNGFDASGAKAFGFKVVHIERLPAASLRAEIAAAATIDPKTMYKALRVQRETMGFIPDVVIASLAELPAALERVAQGRVLR